MKKSSVDNQKKIQELERKIHALEESSGRKMKNKLIQKIVRANKTEELDCISLAELDVDELFSKYEQVMTTSVNSDRIKNEMIEINNYSNAQAIIWSQKWIKKS